MIWSSFKIQTENPHLVKIENEKLSVFTVDDESHSSYSRINLLCNWTHFENINLKTIIITIHNTTVVFFYNLLGCHLHVYEWFGVSVGV